MTDYDGDEARVTEWEDGLPTSDDLTPLSQPLIPPELASAFKISSEPRRTLIDVNRASEKTLSSLRLNNNSHSFAPRNFNSENDDDEEEDCFRSDRNKTRKADCNNLDEEEEEEYSVDDQSSNRTLKRPRLVWTPQLHKRFVEVVARLGIKNAVPKTIMQLMNVEGLTRENVASHLQKYRLYLKRMHGLSSPNDQGQSVSDSLFDSATVPDRSDFSGGNAHAAYGASIPIAMPYSQAIMTMPIMGMHHPYNMMQQQRDWSCNTFGAYPSYVAPTEK